MRVFEFYRTIFAPRRQTERERESETRRRKSKYVGWFASHRQRHTDKDTNTYTHASQQTAHTIQRPDNALSLAAAHRSSPEPEQSQERAIPDLAQWHSRDHAASAQTMPVMQPRPSLRNGHCWTLLCTQASGHCRPDTAPFIQASASLRLGKGHADDDARREGGGSHDEGAR